ncbi:hypothetical protein ACWD4Z_00625 [Streptomyces antibioticus]|uniref:hypothetical protein n=1 Tax=Streptomyces antibioticus TaxID=1890 RepID=UPI0022536CA9|nr:hypothetical protein [Streptomyces antibioticus]MCX5173276.1 hypothetical protein [Streptomyces antibioticus]
MSGWITLGLGTAAALCPLPGGSGPAVAVDTAPAVPHVVVCADDGWVEIGGDPVRRPPVTRSPRPAPRPSLPPVRPAPAPGPADDAVPTAPSPSKTSPPRRAERPVPAPEAPPEAAPPAAPPARAPGVAPFRWVPRFHYAGRSARPAPAGLSTTTTTVVITTPAVLAAAALRPGSRRRNAR